MTSIDWQDSADRMTAAFAAAPLDRPVRLIEISADQRFPAGSSTATGTTWSPAPGPTSCCWTPRTSRTPSSAARYAGW